MPEPVKTLPVFFIDNQGLWPNEAKLAGDLVLWTDHGKYPTYIPVCIADHPCFDGKVVVQAGNRGLIVTFVQGARSMEDIRKYLNKVGQRPDQVRVALDAIVQRIMLQRAAEEGDDRTKDDSHPFALLRWLGRHSPDEAHTLVNALRAYMKAVGALGGKDEFERVDQLLHAVEQGLDQRDAEHTEPRADAAPG